MTTPDIAATSSKSNAPTPDVQLLLANERTLLAWIRTALALLAGGLALTQFGDHTTSKTLTGSAVILLGAIMAATGYIRFQNASKAIQKGQTPVVGHGPRLQVAIVIGFALMVIGIELVTLL